MKFKYTGPLTTHGDQVLFPGSVVDLQAGAFVDGLLGLKRLVPVAEPEPEPPAAPEPTPEIPSYSRPARPRRATFDTSSTSEKGGD